MGVDGLVITRGWHAQSGAMGVDRQLTTPIATL